VNGKEAEGEEGKDGEKKKEADESGEARKDEDPECPAEVVTSAPEKKNKKKTRSIDLSLVAKVPQMSKNEINYFVEQELGMIMQDKKEKERSEAKNLVEEYVYEVRDKLSNEFEPFITAEVRTLVLIDIHFIKGSKTNSVKLILMTVYLSKRKF